MDYTIRDEWGQRYDAHLKRMAVPVREKLDRVLVAMDEGRWTDARNLLFIAQSWALYPGRDDSKVA